MSISALSGAIVYRAASLKFYATTHSTIGARTRGGRFNRPGVSALYLALDADTAIAEYWQTDPPGPLVLIPNALDAKNLLDIRTSVPTSFGADWKVWAGDWKSAREEVDNGNPAADCPSWRCGDDAVARRLTGIIYPSTKRSGGANVVLFTDNIVAGTMDLKVLDPFGEIAAANPPILT